MDLVACISKPHFQTQCVTRRLDGPRAAGFDRWGLLSIVTGQMADNKSTTVLTCTFYSLLNTDQLRHATNTQHGRLPQQLTPLCLLVSPAIASLKTPPICQSR